MYNINFFYNISFFNDILYYNNIYFNNISYDVIINYEYIDTYNFKINFFNIFLNLKLLILFIDFIINILNSIILIIYIILTFFNKNAIWYDIISIYSNFILLYKILLYQFIYIFLDLNTYKNTWIYYFFILIIILINLFLLYLIKIIIELNLIILNFIYYFHFFKKPKFSIYKIDISILYKYLFYKIGPPNESLIKLWFFWHNSIIDNKKVTIFLYKLNYYILLPFAYTKNWAIKNNINSFGLFIYALPLVFFRYWTFLSYHFQLRSIQQKRNPIIINNKSFHIFIYEKFNFIRNYTFFFLPYYYKKYYKMLIFVINFFFNYFLFVLLKFIIKFSFLNKIINIFLYYFINIIFYLKKILNFFIVNLLWSIYLKFKIFIAYYLNMYLHNIFYKNFTIFFFFNVYYNNTELYDKFPLYQSNFILNLFYFISPFKKEIYSNFFPLLKTLKIYFLFFLYFFFDYTILIFYNTFLFLYYFFYLKLKFINILQSYNNNNKIIIISITIILFYLLFLKNNLIYLFVFFLIYLLLYISKIFYNNIINKIYYYKIFYLLGFLFFFFIDIINILNKKLIKYFILLIKYFIFYPFIIFLFFFFITNNKIIYLTFLGFLKIFIIFIYKFIFYILNYFYDFYRFYFLDVEYFIIELDNFKAYYNELQLNYNIHMFYNIFDLTDKLNNYENIFKDQYWRFRIYYIIKEVIIGFIAILPLCINYYIKMFLFSILNLFPSLYYTKIMSLDIYFSSIPIILIKTYYTFFKYIYFYYIYIYIPYYFVQPILAYIILIHEYYYIISHFLYNIFFINYVKILIIYIYILLKLKLLNLININLISIITYFIYNIYAYIINIYIFIYYFFNIYNFFFLDILNYYHFTTKILLYTNLDFLFFKNYNNFFIYKDFLYSWSRFPINNFIKFNNKLPRIYNSYDLWYDWSYLYWEKLYNIDYDLWFYSIDETTTRFWLYQYIKYNSSKFMIFYFKITKFRRLLKLFPFLRINLLYYFFFIYIILNIFLIFLYKNIFKNNDNVYIYASNAFLWDKLRHDTINNNFKLYKKNLKFYNYYYKNIVTNKEDLNNTEYRFVSDRDEDCDTKGDDIINDLLVKEKNKHKLFLLQYYAIRVKKDDYVKLYKNYNKFRHIMSNISKLTSSSFIKKLNKNILILKKLKKLNKNIRIHKYFYDNITFNFKNLNYIKNYNFLYNFFLDKKIKFNLFFSYYYKKDINMPFIYDHFFEESYNEGPFILRVNDNNFYFLKNKIDNIYLFFKWLDNIFLNNKGSYYFFHKDPSVCFLGIDSTTNNKYYINSSYDIDLINILSDLILFAIPVLLWYIHFVCISIINHEEADQIVMALKHQILFYLCWFLSQFESLHTGVLKFFWGTFESNINNIEARWDTWFDGNHKYSWFNYNKLNIYFFPLYIYCKTQFFLSHIYHIIDHTPWSVFKLSNILGAITELLKIYILDFINFIYIRFINLYNFYSINLIYFYIIKIIIFFFLIIIIKFKYIDFSFYRYNKYTLNVFHFSEHIRKINYKNIYNLFYSFLFK